MGTLRRPAERPVRVTMTDPIGREGAAVIKMQVVMLTRILRNE